MDRIRPLLHHGWPIQRELPRIEEMEKDAYALYADQEYQSVILKMDEISGAAGLVRIPRSGSRTERLHGSLR